MNDSISDAVERVGLLLVLLQLVVHRLHEAVEVAALLVAERQALEKQIHQPRLAAADADKRVEALERPIGLAHAEQPAERGRLARQAMLREAQAAREAAVRESLAKAA